MNIFEYYLSEIHDLVLNHKDELKLNNLDSINSINLEVPPEKFNFDLSCNISLVLAKSNKLKPIILASQLKTLFKEKIENFDQIEIAGPGFLNIKLSNAAIVKNIDFKANFTLEDGIKAYIPEIKQLHLNNKS